MNNERTVTERGIAVMNELQFNLANDVVNYLEKTEKGLSSLITDFVFGTVIARKGLDLKTREMLTVASLISIGTASKQLELHMKAALNVGVSKSELLEVIIQMAVYTGIPSFMNALHIYNLITDKDTE